MLTREGDDRVARRGSDCCDVASGLPLCPVEFRAIPIEEGPLTAYSSAEVLGANPSGECWIPVPLPPLFGRNWKPTFSGKRIFLKTGDAPGTARNQAFRAGSGTVAPEAWDTEIVEIRSALYLNNSKPSYVWVRRLGQGYDQETFAR